MDRVSSEKKKQKLTFGIVLSLLSIAVATITTTTTNSVIRMGSAMVDVVFNQPAVTEIHTAIFGGL